jgi:hypothetical protein
MHLSLQTLFFSEDLTRNIFNHLPYVHCATFQTFRQKGENSCDCIQFDIRTSHYLHTPWNRVLLEKLTVNFAASQEIPHIYGTQKFLTVPASTSHLMTNIVHTLY